MIACCPLCYQHYINNDGTVDQQAFENAKRECLEQQNSKNEKVVQRLIKTLENPCLCDCHIKASSVLH